MVAFAMQCFRLWLIGFIVNQHLEPERMPSIVPPPGGRLVFALNREKFSFVVGVFFFFFSFFGLVVFLFP